MSKQESQPTQQFVDIEEIKDDVVVLKSGSLRRVLMVSGINFELKSEDEQNVVTYSYQNFLNTLDFSLETVIHSRKLNIEGYLNLLRGREAEEENELLKNQISEYTEFIRSFVEMNAIMAKTFFAVVPYDSISLSKRGRSILGFVKFGKGKEITIEQTYDQKLVQLNQRTDQVISGLAQIGLRAVALNREELIELFYNLYNPESVEKKELAIAKE